MLKKFLSIHVIERARLACIKISRLCRGNNVTPDNLIKRKFLFNTQYIHAFSELEFMCAAKLKLQGHEVLVIICDGLPYSEREIADLPNVNPYKKCSSRTQRYCNAYGLDYIKINDFLQCDEKKRAYTLSRGVMANIRNYTKNNINLGEFAKRNHSHYFKGDIQPVGEFELIYRKAFEAAYLTECAMSKILKKYNNYDLVTANGKFIQSGIPAELTKNSGNNFYTYEHFRQGNAIIVDKNRCSCEQGMNDVWLDLQSRNLNQYELQRLYHSFDLQQKSISLEDKLWDENRIDDDDEIISELGIDEEKKIIACYPNVYWDSTHMGISAVSKDLTHWLIDMINFAKANKNIQLIIRTHPAEQKVIDIIRSKHTLSDTLHEAFTKMPPNVIIIEPTSNISSYSLARIADANLLWNGTIGLELALRGIKPIVIADSYYSNKGFTIDFLNFDKLENFLINFKSKPTISSEEKKLAENFCYHVRFHRKFNAPFYLGTRSYFHNYAALKPGNNKTLDNLAGFFLNHNSYMKIGSFSFD